MNDSVHQHIKNGYKKMNHLVPSQHKKMPDYHKSI